MHTSFGGIERLVATLADMLSQDYAVTIIANYGNSSDEAFSYPKNVSIKYLLPKLPEIISLKKLLKQKNPGAIIREFNRRHKLNSARRHALKNALKDLDTDIIITERAFYSSAVNKYCKNQDILKIATDHNHHQSNKKYIKELISSVRNFDSLVVATPELRDFYKTKIKDTKCVLIPNPLSHIPTKKTTFANRNLISAGRLSPEKGFIDLINVMETVQDELPETKLFLLGDGPEKSAIQTEIKRLNLEKSIVMPGFVRHEDIAPYFYDSSLFILTSHTEAFGLVLTEAMSYGLPCVAFDSASGARAQITPQTGVLIKDRNQDKMAHAIIDLLRSPQTLKTYQKQIAKNINAFSKSVVLQDWKKILESQKLHISF